MMGTKARPRERVRRAMVAQMAPVHAPLRPWHWVLLLLALLLGCLALVAPGLLADVAAYPLADWRAFVAMRGGIIILAVYALVFIRSYHPLVGAGLAATILGLSLRIGQGQITEEPLTVGYALLLFGLAVTPVRIIIRPNDAEMIRRLQDENAGLRERCGEEDR